MSALLQSAVAAQSNGLRARKCPACHLRGPAAVGPCPVCNGTEISPSVEDLSYAAFHWLGQNTTELTSVVCGSPDGSESKGVQFRLRVELHDGTREGVTAAILRLIAHAGVRP